MKSPVPPEVRAAVLERDSHACVRCFRTTGLSVHHRQPRGMGGSSRGDVHAMANLIVLDGDGVRGCHGYVESHRAESYRLGYLVPSGEDPAAWPVYRGRGFWQQPGEGWVAAWPQPGQSADDAPW